MLTSRFEMWLGWGDDLCFFYNDAYVPTLGIKHPTALGRPFHEVWSEVYADVADQVARVRAGEATWNQALLLLLERSGYPEETYHSFSYSPLYDESGAVKGMLCIVNEETERVIGERRLDTLRRLGMNLVGATDRSQVREAVCDIFAANRRDFPFVLLGLASGERIEITGCTPDVGNMGDIEWPADVIGTTGTLAIALDVDRSWPTGAWDIPPREALVLPIPGTADQSPFGTLILGLNPYRRNDPEIADFARLIAGQVSGALGNIAALDAERRRADRIWLHSRDLIVVVDAEGVFRSVSPSWEVVFGYPSEEVAGRPFADFIADEDLGPSTQALAAALADGDLTGYENRFRTRAGNYRWISWHTAMEGGLVYAYGRDVTDQKESVRALAAAEDALRQAQKMEAVGQLTGGIAHDFNNLLAGISGSLEIIERRMAQGRTEGLERFLKGAQSSAQRAASLTQRLLAFSRRQTLDPRPTDINRLVRGMEDLIGRTVGPAIAVEVVGAGGLWPARVDAAQLESALLNLAINARDAMPDGGRITIETANKWLDERGARERDLTPGQYISICVTDSGTGIPKEIVDRIFDPFFTTKPIGQGTGLGLSMIHGFVRQSGGQVRVYSEPGEGTTMCLYLPRHVGAVDEDEPNDTSIAASGAGETVLVIDDEPTVRMLIVDILEEAGYASIEASDGQSGLKILESDTRIDLLITDVGLPGGMNGRQVADAARIFRPDLKVLFVTGFAENAVVGNGHLPPGMEVITKPFVMADLANKITDLIEGANSAR
ncbi:PAS domain-containing protein [Novosphingobium sp. G106]|nr:PAS domain-containing protein [Novosphingobium sp. G106]